MLFVEEIRYKPPLGSWVTKQSIRYTRELGQRGILVVRLRDMQTGCSEEFSTYTSPAGFVKDISRRNPYGYLKPNFLSSEFLLITSDRLSFQFLQYVESVTPVSFPLSDTRWMSLMSCYFYDRLGTFVEWWHSDEEYICPIFQMMCFLSDGWHGDKFYFKCNELRGFKSNSGMCVTFNDAHKARALIAKAIASGYNPMLKYAKVLGVGGSL